MSPSNQSISPQRIKPTRNQEEFSGYSPPQQLSNKTPGKGINNIRSLSPRYRDGRRNSIDSNNDQEAKNINELLNARINRLDSFGDDLYNP